MSVGPKAVCMIEQVIENTHSIDPATRIIHHDGAKEENSECNKDNGDDRYNEQERTTLAYNKSRQYAVNRIICHLEIPMAPRYVIHW